MAVELPHFAAPFAFNRQGHAQVVEQGSDEELRSTVYNIAVCVEGYREDLPEYGVPDLSFNTVPLDIEAFDSAIERWEPRANLDTEEFGDVLEAAARTIIVEVE